MIEQQMRRHMQWEGKDDDEIEDAIAEWADAENDRRAEDEYMKEKANADKG